MTVPLLCTVTLTAANGLSEDAVQNNWAILAPDGWDSGSDIGDITFPLASFYQGFAGTLANSIMRGAGAINYAIYNLTGNLDGSPHGSPVAEDSSALTGAAASAIDLPREVACVITLRGAGALDALAEAPDGADPGSEPDRPRQRRTGRVYMGPWSTVDNVGAGRPSTTLLTGLRNSTATLMNSLQVNGCELAVWSRKDQAMRVVTHVETDDAWDTVRSRGVAATTRVSLATP